MVLLLEFALALPTKEIDALATGTAWVIEPTAPMSSITVSVA